MQKNDVPKKHLVLSAGQKGGVAKTLMTALILSHLRTSGATVAAYDADGSVGGLLRLAGDYDAAGKLKPDQDPLSGVFAYDIHTADGRSTLLDSLDSPAKIVLHDLAGGSMQDLLNTADGGEETLDTLLETIADFGFRLHLCHLLTPDLASIASAAKWLSFTHDHDVVHYAVVNRHFGAPAAFEKWTQSNTRAALLDRGGVEMELPAFPVSILDKIKDNRIPFSKAAQVGALTITERANFRRCQRGFDASFTPLFDALIEG